jgi:hypothetical protein
MKFFIHPMRAGHLGNSANDRRAVKKRDISTRIFRNGNYFIEETSAVYIQINVASKSY